LFFFIKGNSWFCRAGDILVKDRPLFFSKLLKRIKAKESWYQDSMQIMNKKKDYGSKRARLSYDNNRSMNTFWLSWFLGWLRMTMPMMVAPVF
jgi:hypothetical protein